MFSTWQCQYPVQSLMETQEQQQQQPFPPSHLHHRHNRLCFTLQFSMQHVAWQCRLFSHVPTISARPQLHSEAILWWGSCLQWWAINSFIVSFLIFTTLPKSNLSAFITQVLWNCYCSILALHLHKCSSIPAIGSEENFLLVCRIATTPSWLQVGSSWLQVGSKWASIYSTPPRAKCRKRSSGQLRTLHLLKLWLCGYVKCLEKRRLCPWAGLSWGGFISPIAPWYLGDWNDTCVWTPNRSF